MSKGQKYDFKMIGACMNGRDMTLKQAADSSEYMKEVFQWLIVQGTEKEWNSPLSQFGNEICQFTSNALNSLQERIKRSLVCCTYIRKKKRRKIKHWGRQD